MVIFASIKISQNRKLTLTLMFSLACVLQILPLLATFSCTAYDIFTAYCLQELCCIVDWGVSVMCSWFVVKET